MLIHSLERVGVLLGFWPKNCPEGNMRARILEATFSVQWFPNPEKDDTSTVHVTRIKDLQDTLSSCCSIGEVSKHGQNTDAILVMN